MQYTVKFVAENGPFFWHCELVLDDLGIRLQCWKKHLNEVHTWIRENIEMHFGISKVPITQDNKPSTWYN